MHHQSSLHVALFRSFWTVSLCSVVNSSGSHILSWFDARFKMAADAQQDPNIRCNLGNVLLLG